MALHVVSGRTPWWAPLAVNVLGGLFNDWQQRERNKKENAMYSEAIKQAQAISQNDTGLAPIPEQDIGQGLLNMNIPLPDGYNDNGWANSFHKTDTPLTQFELGTAGIAPTAPSTPTPTAPTAPLNAWANALGNSGNALAQFDANTAGIAPAITEQPAGIATQGRQTGRIPTALDIYNVLGALAGTKRFGSVTPERITALFAPYLKANEEARQEQMRNAAADDYLNQTSGAGRINSVMGNVLRGITPESLGNMVYNQNKPVVSTVDTGGQIQFFNTDPMTGIPTNVGAVNRTLTPQENAANKLSWAQFYEGQRQFDETTGYNYANLHQQGDLERQRMNMESNAVTGQVYTGNDGHQYVLRKNAPPMKLSEVPGLNAQQRAVLENNGTRLTNIQSRREQLQKEKNALILKGQFDQAEEIGQQMKGLDAEEQRILQENASIINSGNTGQQTQTSQPINLPPVSQTPRWIGRDGTTYSEDEIEALVRKAESGQLEGIRTREELYNDFFRKGIIPVEGTVPPININHNNETQANNVTGINGNEVLTSNTSVNNSSIGDFSNIFGATPAYADENISSNNTTLASDTNTEAGIQKALDELNGQFGEQRWADWAAAFNPQDFSNNNDSGYDTANLRINSPMNTATPFGNAVSIPNHSLDGDDSNMVLARSKRPQKKQVYSVYYSGDTRNGGQYSSIINRQAKTHNVDPDLIAAIIQQESGGNSRAVSPVGAGGLMQLMPKTASGLGVTDVFDPEQNIAGGTKYIAQLLRRYNGNIEKALWAYNAGAGNVAKGRLPEETKKYIPSVMARYRKLKGIAPASHKTPKRAVRRRRARNRRRR